MRWGGHMMKKGKERKGQSLWQPAQSVQVPWAVYWPGVTLAATGMCRFLHAVKKISSSGLTSSRSNRNLHLKHSVTFNMVRVNQFASVLKNKFRLKIYVVNGPGPDTQINGLFIDIWSFEWLVCSVRSSFFARNHAIVSCYAPARPGISARSNRRLLPFMWKASWQMRLIHL